jgi:plasmid stabilization system protein ParE
MIHGVLPFFRRLVAAAGQKGHLYCVEYLLSENPKLGAPGRVPGTRELVIPKTPYIVPYRVRGSRIEIARVYHTSRRWPDRL